MEFKEEVQREKLSGGLIGPERQTQKEKVRESERGNLRKRKRGKQLPRERNMEMVETGENVR